MLEVRDEIELRENPPVSDVKTVLTKHFEASNVLEAFLLVEAIIRAGKFLSLLSPLLRTFSADKNSRQHFSALLEILAQAYGIGGVLLFRGKELIRPPLNLSRSGLSETDISSFLKSLRVESCLNHYSNPMYPPNRAVHFRHLLHLDLSDNNLTVNPRAFQPGSVKF